MLSKEMSQMVEVIKEFDSSLCNGINLARYFAPDIPKKIMKKLIKNFDSNLPINSVVAYYDTTFFNSSKEGIIFTNEGIYYKTFLNKAFYLPYMEIEKVDEEAVFKLKNGEKLILKIDYISKTVLKELFRSLVQIDEIYGQTSFRQIGEVKKKKLEDLPLDIYEKCNLIIHSAATACGGVGTGLAQLPCSDSVPIITIQVAMIVSLGKVFELHITESTAKSILSTFVSTYTGRTLSQVAVGWIPVLGNAINTFTAFGITESIGWFTAENFYKRWENNKIEGKLEGMKAGYTEASGEYEQKLRKQAEAFLNQTKDFEKEKKEYDKLIDDYEAYIRELEQKGVNTNLIEEEKEVYGKLKKLKCY